MSAVLDTPMGLITYTDEIIAKIAGLRAIECYGIVGMASINASDGIGTLLKRENLKKGVKVKSNGTDNVIVELYVIVKYGLSISVVAKNIIDTVKYGVEKATGLNVKEVNIIVQGIKI